MEGDDRKVFLLTEAIEPEKVNISRDRLEQLIGHQNDARWARGIAAIALIFVAILIAGMSYQRGVIQTLHNEIGTLKADKERKPLPTPGTVMVKPC